MFFLSKGNKRYRGRNECDAQQGKIKREALSIAEETIHQGASYSIYITVVRKVGLQWAEDVYIAGDNK